MKIAESLVRVYIYIYIYIDILYTKIANLQVHLFQCNFLTLLGFINGANKRISIIENRAVQALE